MRYIEIFEDKVTAATKKWAKDSGLSVDSLKAQQDVYTNVITAKSSHPIRPIDSYGTGDGIGFTDEACFYVPGIGRVLEIKMSVVAGIYTTEENHILIHDGSYIFDHTVFWQAVTEGIAQAVAEMPAVEDEVDL